MKLSELLDTDLLQEYIAEGLVEKGACGFAPLDLYAHSRRAVLEQVWDDITETCRGLIVHRETGEIVSRPFRKFFNVDTSWKPETCVSNLPLTKPVISEKLDGSMGILYQCWVPSQLDPEGRCILSGIATKGSFHSDQAKWATEWYRDHLQGAEWPEGYTAMFEIIAESVQHHVVHYNGIEELVLLALIKNETGEELNPESLKLWGRRNGVRVTDFYDRKGLGDVLNEDRKNAEGYVLSWPRAGQPPLKIKVKHPSFLDLQKIVHAATPRAILDALMHSNVDLLNSWIGQTNDQLGQWVQSWVVKFNGKYANILLKCRMATNAAITKNETRKDFALYIQNEASKFEYVHPSVCFAMLDGKDHRPIIWKFVEKAFEGELSQASAVVEEQ